MGFGFEQVFGAFIGLAGVAYVVAAWRWERFEFAPYLEAPYWEQALKSQTRSFRILSVLVLVCCVAMLYLAATGAQLDVYHYGMAVWGVSTVAAIRIRAHRIQQLLDREANRPLEPNTTPPQSRLTTKA